MDNNADIWQDDVVEPPKPESANANLHKAKTAKQDEFYTKRSDIEAEVAHYKHHFKGKVVYCNCDNPAWSNFPKFFEDNYDALGLKGLLTNHLRPDGSGDFRGKAALAQLEQADIVVTNPPFSLFRQFIAQMIDAKPEGGGLLEAVEPSRDKKFLIIGNLNAITYMDVFPLMRNNKLWLGVINGAMEFTKPDGTSQKLGNVAWFTNLDHPARHKDLVLTRKYDPAIHRKYDNRDMINVDKMKDIPCDYAGEMGVPITFMQSYNPAQFEVFDTISDGLIDGETKYKRIIVINRKPTVAS